MKLAPLILALLLVGCAPVSRVPVNDTATVQNPTSTQVTVVAQSQPSATDVVSLADSIRFSGAALVLAALIITFGRSSLRAFQRTRRDRGPSAS